MEGGEKNPQNIDNLEENGFSSDLFGLLGEGVNIIVQSSKRLLFFRRSSCTEELPDKMALIRCVQVAEHSQVCIDPVG